MSQRRLRERLLGGTVSCHWQLSLFLSPSPISWSLWNSLLLQCHVGVPMLTERFRNDRRSHFRKGLGEGTFLTQPLADSVSVLFSSTTKNRRLPSETIVTIVGSSVNFTAQRIC